MSVVMVGMQVSISDFFGDNPYLSTDRLTVASVTFPYGEAEGGPAPFGGPSLLHIGTPHQNQRASKAALSYYDDYYNRIHLIPDRIDLGNLLADQTRYVEVWNSYTNVDTLSGITSSGTTGLSLTAPIVAPTTFAPNESRLYALSISLDGPPVILASYTFEFSTESPVLDVTGNRVVVWPFIPQTRFKETLEWKTDVIETYNREQRLALRLAPRQSWSYEFQLTPRQLSRAKAMSTAWSQRLYGLPIWPEATYVGGLAQDATSVALDTSNADYRGYDLILIWEDDENFVAVECTDVFSSSINLKLPLSRSFTSAWVMPLRFARTPTGTSFTRTASDISLAKLRFLVSNNVDLSGANAFPTYRSAPVITDRTVLVGNFEEKIVRGATFFDNGSGPILSENERAYPERSETITFDQSGRADIWSLRQFLHTLKGKQKSFWTISWNPDLVLLADIAPTDSTISVQDIGYHLFYDVSDIVLVKKDGTFVFNRILSGGLDPGGYEVLNLEATFGTSIPMADIDMICFMRHVRLNSDNLELTHDLGERVSCSTNTMEVPE